MDPRPNTTLGPRPEHDVEVSSPRGPPWDQGLHSHSLRTSGALARTKMSVRPAGSGPSPEGVPRDYHPPATPGAPWNSPATPLASVSSEFPSPEARSPHGVGRGRYPRTTRRSQDPTGIERRRRARGASSSPASAGPRGPVPAPTPAAPELRLMRFSQPGGSFSSSAIFPPAAEPAPPPPHRLCRPRPPTAAVDWLSPPYTGSWRQHSLGTLTVRTDSPASY